MSPQTKPTFSYSKRVYVLLLFLLSAFLIIHTLLHDQEPVQSPIDSAGRALYNLFHGLPFSEYSIIFVYSNNNLEMKLNYI